LPGTESESGERNSPDPRYANRKQGFERVDGIMGHPLDNPVWHALTGPHAGVALGHGAARHYPRDMAPFSALAADAGRLC
jgi:hypothetical protein